MRIAQWDCINIIEHIIIAEQQHQHQPKKQCDGARACMLALDQPHQTITFCHSTVTSWSSSRKHIQSVKHHSVSIEKNGTKNDKQQFPLYVCAVNRPGKIKLCYFNWKFPKIWLTRLDFKRKLSTKQHIQMKQIALTIYFDIALNWNKTTKTYIRFSIEISLSIVGLFNDLNFKIYDFGFCVWVGLADAISLSLWNHTKWTA